jgi:sugar/nucleoside kinase (ribokinase family)
MLSAPVAQVDVMDTTGAGDGFLGGFLHYFVKAGDVLRPG